MRASRGSFGGGRNADDRLARLERRLDALKSLETLPKRWEMTEGELIETGLILLAYGYDGDAEAFAENLVQDHGLPFQQAEGLAGKIGRILEERRAVASDPRYPV